MARKKGILDAIISIFRFFWNAAVFIAKGMLWVLRGIWKILSWIFGFASSAAKKTADERAKPKTTAEYEEPKELKAVHGAFSDFEARLVNSKSTIGIILGARGSGKSALGMRLLENVHAKTGRKVAAMGFKPDSVPGWIHCINSPDEAPNGCMLLVDEGGITFGSRDAMSNANKLLSALLLVARHKDLSVLFISQNSSNIDVNALRQADFLLLKRSSLLQGDFERKKIKEIYDEHGSGFQEFAMPGATLVYSDEFLGFAESSLPSFWSEKASKAFKDFSSKK